MPTRAHPRSQLCCAHLVLDSLWSARWAMQGRPYEQAVKAAIQLGDDTAAIAGGLAEIRDGLEAILRDRQQVESLIDRACADGV